MTTMRGLMSFLTSCSTIFLLLLPKDMVAALRCYSCAANANRQTAGCQALDTTITMPQECSAKQTFCKVERVIYENELAKFYRGCVETCTPECLIIPGSEKCLSCCQSDLCNVGNRGQHQHPVDIFNVLSLLPVALLPNLSRVSWF